MSIPSSSEAVATTLGNSPRFRASSVSRRSSWLRLPWCDRATISDPAKSGRRPPATFRLRPARSAALVSFSTTRRLLAKMIVERCSRDQIEQPRSITGQIDPSGRGVDPPNGAITAKVELLATAGVDDRHRPGLEPRRPSPGRPSANRPGSGRLPRAGAGWPKARLRTNPAGLIRSSRSSSSARKTPRLFGQRA